MKLTGKIWKFPQDDIDTGLIRKQMCPSPGGKGELGACQASGVLATRAQAVRWNQSSDRIAASSANNAAAAPKNAVSSVSLRSSTIFAVSSL